MFSLWLKTNTEQKYGLLRSLTNYWIQFRLWNFIFSTFSFYFDERRVGWAKKQKHKLIWQRTGERVTIQSISQDKFREFSFWSLIWQNEKWNEMKMRRMRTSRSESRLLLLGMDDRHRWWWFEALQQKRRIQDKSNRNRDERVHENI